jgi:hypothetical protein
MFSSYSLEPVYIQQCIDFPFVYCWLLVGKVSDIPSIFVIWCVQLRLQLAFCSAEVMNAAVGRCRIPSWLGGNDGKLAEALKQCSCILPL